MVVTCITDKFYIQQWLLHSGEQKIQGLCYRAIHKILLKYVICIHMSSFLELCSFRTLLGIVNPLFFLPEGVFASTQSYNWCVNVP